MSKRIKQTLQIRGRGKIQAKRGLIVRTKYYYAFKRRQCLSKQFFVYISIVQYSIHFTTTPNNYSSKSQNILAQYQLPYIKSCYFSSILYIKDFQGQKRMWLQAIFRLGILSKASFFNILYYYVYFLLGSRISSKNKSPQQPLMLIKDRCTTLVCQSVSPFKFKIIFKKISCSSSIAAWKLLGPLDIGHNTTQFLLAQEQNTSKKHDHQTTKKNFKH